MAVAACPPILRPPMPVRLLPAAAGFSAVLGQIVLLRELIVICNGNELSLGVMLAAWLAWNALGSVVGGRIFRNLVALWIPAAAASVACGLSLPATVLAIRYARTLFTSAPTEVMNPWATLLICVVCLSIFCALCGYLFAVAVRMNAQPSLVPLHRILGRAYLLETAGTGIGGILASMLLLRHFGSLQTAFLVCGVDLCVAAALFRPLSSRGRIRAIIPIAALCLPVIFFVAPAAERWSQQKQWSPLTIIASRDSIYGRITITDAGGMRSIYEDGNILSNVPDKAAAEEAVHYALLEHPAPRRVLLLGNSAIGSIAEALQYRTIEQVDVVELDPALASMLPRFLSGETHPTDSRVHPHFGDGRHYLQAAHALFDVIIVSVPDPDMAQRNRFYTLEFFRLARKRLAPGGILALQLRSSEEFISAQRAEFLRCIRATLVQAFPHIAVIPGDPIHMFAGENAASLTSDPQVLVARLRARKLDTQYVREYMLPYRMSAERIDYVEQALRPVPATPVNRDFHPVAYYFNEVLWTSQFRADYGAWLRALAKIPGTALFAFAIAVSLAIVLLLSMRRSQESRARATSGYAVSAGGYCLMTLQILVLLTFQSIYGYLYYEIALLIGMFMTGIASGSWLGLRITTRSRPPLLAAANQFILSACAPLLMLAAGLLARAPEELAGKPLSAMGFPLIAFLCGIPGGLLFAFSAEIRSQQRREVRPQGAGSLYALDLLGGCVGAFLITGFLVPVYGLWKTAWLAAIVNLGPAILLLRALRTHRPNSTPMSDARQRLLQ